MDKSDLLLFIAVILEGNTPGVPVATMGNACTNASPEEKLQQKRSREIDKMMQNHGKAMQEEVKLLLLG